MKDYEGVEAYVPDKANMSVQGFSKGPERYFTSLTQWWLR